MIVRTERLSAWPAEAYRGTFAPTAPEPKIGGDLPYGWEGVYFPFDTPLSRLRPDGTPATDGLPNDVDGLLRRYAGEDTVFHRPLRYGDEVTQTTRRGAVTEKHGRAGRLVFADIVREYRVGGELAIESVWHDVFLEPRPSRPPTVAPMDVTWTEQTTLDERQLFRFSGLTFNTHRVHYDRRWAVEVEGLPDLLVHGPLTRNLLLDAASRHHPGWQLVRYEFRALAPITAGLSVRIASRNDAEVMAIGPDGGLLARGRIEWTKPR